MVTYSCACGSSVALCAQQNRKPCKILMLAAFVIVSELVLPHAVNLGYLASSLLIGFGTWDGCIWPSTFSSGLHSTVSWQQKAFALLPRAEK